MAWQCKAMYSAQSWLINARQMRPNCLPHKTIAMDCYRKFVELKWRIQAPTIKCKIGHLLPAEFCWCSPWVRIDESSIVLPNAGKKTKKSGLMPTVSVFASAIMDIRDFNMVWVNYGTWKIVWMAVGDAFPWIFSNFLTNKNEKVNLWCNG
jgi:hypothetical protein